LEAIKQTDYARAEKELRQALAIEPDNTDIQFQLARVLSWQGKQKDAGAIYRDLLTRDPDNTDYLLGLGQTLVWSGQRDEALAVLDRAHRLDGRNLDIRRLRIQALAGGDENQRQQARTQWEQAKKEFPAFDWGVMPEVSPQPTAAPGGEQRPDRSRPLSTQIEIGGSHDSLSNQRAEWNAQYLEFSKRLAPRTSLYAGAQRTERFDLEDAQFQLGGSIPLSERWTLQLDGTYSPTARVVARHSETVRLQHSFDFGLVLAAGYRYREYSVNDTQAALFSAEQYLGNFRLAYNYSPSFVRNESAHNHNVQLGYWYTDDSFVNLSYSVGNEINNIETSESQGRDIRLVSFQVESYGINGRHWITPEWAISWSFGHQWLGPFFERTGGHVGLRWAF
jgi:YaiO family outer membrane protein